jgi:hypothetical protein
MPDRHGAAAEERAKKDVVARSRRVFVQMGPGQECRHNGGWMREQAWVETAEKRASKSLTANSSYANA